MDRLWGEMVPVPERNVRLLSGGERVLGGSFEVAYTPGHAKHHVSYLHDGTAFAGDVGGIRIPPSTLAFPPTPPPDIDVEAWHESIALLRSWRPQRIAVTHFGVNDEVESQLDQLEARLEEWSELARSGGHDAFVSAVQDAILSDASGEQVARYAQAAPVAQMYDGYVRYWSKRALNRRPARSRARGGSGMLAEMSLTVVELPRVRRPGEGLGDIGVLSSSMTTSTRSITWPRRSRASFRA